MKRIRAIFAVMALLAGRRLCAQPAPMFTDVPVTDQVYAATLKMYNTGITTGCQLPGQLLAFCPDRLLTRGEMAAFIVKSWSLRIYGDANWYTQLPLTLSKSRITTPTRHL